MQIPPTSADLRILQSLRFLATFTIFQYVIVKFAIFCTSYFVVMQIPPTSAGS